MSLFQLPHRESGSHRTGGLLARRLWFTGLICSLAAVACHELPTAPDLRPDRPPALTLSDDPQWGRNSSPNSGSWSGQVDLWDGHAPMMSTPWVFPYKTIIIVTIAGDDTQADGALTGSGTVWGPTGLTNVNGLAGAIGFRLASTTGSSMWWPQANKTVDTVIVQYNMAPLRGAVDGAQPDLGPNTSNCGRSNSSIPPWPCYTYPGTASLTFTRPHVGLTMTLSGASVIKTDSIVTFTAGMEQTSIGGRAVDMSDVRWRWVSDAPPQSGDTLTCDGADGLTCTRRIRGSGTMYMSAYVNGEQQQQSMRVDVVPRDKCEEYPEFATQFPELANSVMDTAMKRLWKDSKYSRDSLDTSRREIGGWIVKEGNTYRFEQYEYDADIQHGPCWTDSPVPPPGTVATIHSHPFSVGDSYSACGDTSGRFKTSDGSWGRYPGTASGTGYPKPKGDYGELDWLFNHPDKPDVPSLDIKGFIIDNDGIISYDRTDLQNGPGPGIPRVPGRRHQRCSY